MKRRWILVLRAALLVAVAVLGGCAGAGLGPAPIPGAPNPAAPAVARLACKEPEIRIDLLDAVGALPDDTLEAQREQLRDWVWTVTLGRLAAKSPADQVLAGASDLPVVRDGALAHVLAMPVGPARAASTKGGDVIVMVEHGPKDVMDAAVLEAIDQEAQHLGRAPARAILYEYEIDRGTAVAQVCAAGEMGGAEIAGAARGYRSAQIRSAQDLERFLAGGVDLLTAECTDAGLSVTGRTRPRDAGGGAVSVEQVAAIARRLGTRYLPPERFGQTVATLPRDRRARVDSIARALDTLAAHPTQIDAMISRFSPKDQQAFHTMLAWKEDNAGASSADVVLSFQLASAFASRPGFSLDPLTTKDAALRGLDEAAAALSDGESVARLYHGWSNDKVGQYYSDAIARKGPAVLEDARRDLAGARKLIVGASEQVVDKILRGWLTGGTVGDNLAESVMFGVYEANSRQCARYDGPLAGTATGMTLFYTDLLAKLSMDDYQGVAPEDAVDGFVSVVHQNGSTTSCQDKRLSTRIWFGLREESYSRRSAGDVRFAPVATRIFAKGSQFGHDEAEVEPGASAARFIRFWDDHHAAIAGWEPQYEVLNQIMKWSVVAQSAALSGKAGCLGFLDAVQVSTDRRFDRWVASTPALRWRGPVKLVAEASKTTECLPLLRSEVYRECGVPTRLTGGVSAATAEQVASKEIVAEPRAVLGRFADAKPSSVVAERVRFEKVSLGGGELRAVEIEVQPRATSFRAELDPEASQRGAASWSRESPIRTVDKTVELDAQNSLVAKERVNGVLTREIRASDLRRADVHLAVELGPEAEAQRIAQHVADTDGTLAEAVAAADLGPGREAFALPDGRVVVRYAGEGQGKGYYAVMESGGGNRGPPANLGKFRLGLRDGGAHAPGSSRGAVLDVTLLPEAEGKAYVTEQSGTPIAPREAPPGLVEKLAGGDDPTIQQISERARSGKASASELDRIERGIDRAEALARRSGKDAAPLDKLRLEVSIRKSTRLMASLREQRILEARAGNMDWYAPPEYPADAGLPPAVHPRGGPLAPGQRYVSRVVAYAESAPAQIDVDGAALLRRGPPGGGGGGGRGIGAASEVGSPYRLLGAGVGATIAVVMRCREDYDRNRDALPPCREPPSREDREEREGMRRKFAAAIKTCDTDGDGRISSPAEEACVKAELKKVHMELVPPEKR